MVGVVDGPYLPFTMRQWPFVVLPNIDMVFLLQLPTEYQIKVLDLPTRLLYHLPLEVEL